MTMSRAEAEEFLYAETRLIDDDRLEEWLQLFTADGVYWIPSYEESNPDEETSIMYDDALQREKRVFQLRHKHLAQDPRSRTVHFVSNVEVEEGDSGNDASVRCNTLIVEMRPGDHQWLQPGLGEQRALAARCRYRLRRQDDGWRIALKEVLLIDRDLPLENITFIL